MRETPLFRTPVSAAPSARPIQPHEGCVALGSCFAQEMGTRMDEHGLRVLCNPLGTLYNPASIALLVHHAMEGGTGHLPLFETRGRWRCWLAGTQVEGESRADITAMVASRLEQLGQALRSAAHLIVTLGTSVCYRLRDSGEVVANCHKMPASLFQEDSLTTGQCADVLTGMVGELLRVNPHLNVTFTVSPYRYAKYGYHRSQLAKATLLLAVDEVCRRQEEASYFPAYELLLDELRDYRFYADDMLHPSPLAADYIWQRFCQSRLSARAKDYVREYEPIRKGLAHRPSDPGSAQYRAFRQALEVRRGELRKKYGFPCAPEGDGTRTVCTQQNNPPTHYVHNI